MKTVEYKNPFDGKQLIDVEKNFLKRSDIQEALENNDLHYFYDLLITEVCEDKMDTSSVSYITHMLYDCGINIFDYISFVPSYAFCHQSLNYINIPKNVKNIHSCAFECTELKEITIPGNVQLIGDSCFYNSSIEMVEIKEGVETIGDYAFGLCADLKEIYLPSSISDFGVHVFYDTNNPKIYVVGGSYAEDVCVQFGWEYETI